MPELPEVQTIVNQLKEKIVGQTIHDVTIRLPKVFQGSSDQVLGTRILDINRRAKIIIIKLDKGLNIVVHLKMTGQLIYGEPDKKDGTYFAETISFSQGIPFAGFALPGKTTHVVFDLDNGNKLFYNDMRQFGWVKILTDRQLQEIHEKHGPEPFSSDFTPEYLEKILSNWGRPVKLLLLEQSKIAGIGNIYANEALWLSGISPMKRGREVSKEKILALYDAIKKVLEMGLKYGGSSAADEAFVNALGHPGKMQEHFNVYQKHKTPCPRCGKTITMSRIGGRGTFFCPKCQK